MDFGFQDDWKARSEIWIIWYSLPLIVIVGGKYFPFLRRLLSLMFIRWFDYNIFIYVIKDDMIFYVYFVEINIFIASK